MTSTIREAGTPISMEEVQSVATEENFVGAFTVLDASADDESLEQLVARVTQNASIPSTSFEIYQDETSPLVAQFSGVMHVSGRLSLEGRDPMRLPDGELNSFFNDSIANQIGWTVAQIDVTTELYKQIRRRELLADFDYVGRVNDTNRVVWRRL